MCISPYIIKMINRITLNIQGIVVPDSLTAIPRFHLRLVLGYVMAYSTVDFFADLALQFVLSGYMSPDHDKVTSMILHGFIPIIALAFWVAATRFEIHFAGLAALVHVVTGIAGCEVILYSNDTYLKSAVW
ncbi:MAG: hypothetical protein P4L69_15735 [Desulfosporosinus sp.]|nr:hypothetical protein [Desulfosporosinus sp.]